MRCSLCMFDRGDTLHWKPGPPTLQKTSRAAFSSCKHLCFCPVLIAGRLNWIKHARTCHCPLEPSQVSLVLLYLWLTGFFSKVAASGCLPSEGLAGGPELELEMIITLYCPCQATSLNHLPIQLSKSEKKVGFQRKEIGPEVVFSWFWAKLLQDVQGRRSAPVVPFKCKPFPCC